MISSVAEDSEADEGPDPISTHDSVKITCKHAFDGADFEGIGCLHEEAGRTPEQNLPSECCCLLGEAMESMGWLYDEDRPVCLGPLGGRLSCMMRLY